MRHWHDTRRSFSGKRTYRAQADGTIWPASRNSAWSYSFRPRLRDLADQQLYKLDRSARYGCLAPLWSGTIDTNLIREQWDQLVRLAASLKNRTAPANVIIQRLANSSPSDRLAKALTALGQVVKTINILRLPER
jgi:TnpA family transposase